MTTYYVGSGGSDASAGTSWSTRKLTLNGVEDIPVAATDTVYVGPGIYRETLTVDVSSTAGSPITYIGDYTGQNTDGVGGIVRITGSDNDQTATRNRCIQATTTRNYRTFQGFSFDLTTSRNIDVVDSTGWIVQNCVLSSPDRGDYTVRIAGTGSGNTVRNCVFTSGRFASIYFTHSSTVDNTNHLVENCIFLNNLTRCILIERIGGITIKNSNFSGTTSPAITVSIALTGGQTTTVNNCIFYVCGTALSATATGEITENYNTFFSNGTDRVNTSTGLNSITYPPLFDPRWWLQVTHAGAGPYSAKQLVTPFDLASYSQLINLAGASPPTSDPRSTTVQGAQREWGPLEHDSTLKIRGGVKKSRTRY